MKIQIASDLHLERRPNYEPDPLADFRPAPDRDVLLLAGDIGTYMTAWSFIEKELRRSPVIYVPGNHEYFSWQKRESIDAAWRRKARQIANLHYLVDEGITLKAVRFWGAPWYSDLFGRRDPRHLELVEQSQDDFRRKYNDGGRWTIQRHLDEHARQTQLLRAQARLVDVVITHWPPTKQAIAPRFKGDALNGYFVNDAEDLVEEIGAVLWISGHVHDPYDCVVGATRCVANPVGYPGEAQEVGGFRANRTVEITVPSDM